MLKADRSNRREGCCLLHHHARSSQVQTVTLSAMWEQDSVKQRRQKLLDFDVNGTRSRMEVEYLVRISCTQLSQVH